MQSILKQQKQKVDSNMPTKNPPLLAPCIKFLTKDGTLSEFTGDSGDLMKNCIEYTDLVAIDDECGSDEIVGMEEI